NSSNTREYMPTWSRDGHWIYYAALKEGHDHLLKQNPDTGEVVEVSDRTFTDAREDRDGRVLYMQGVDRHLWKLPLPGGASTFVPGIEGMNVSRYWTLAGNEVYLARAQNGSYSLKKFDPASKKLEDLGPLSNELRPGTPSLSVDPTQHSLVFVREDQDRS